MKGGSKPNIGISLPEYKYRRKANKGSLGGVLRVFASTKEELEQLDLAKITAPMQDYISLTDIDAVGDKARRYEVYTRINKKGLRRRAEKLYEHICEKFGEQYLVEKFGDFEGVLKHCKRTGGDYRQYPFIQTKSNSNGNSYIIRIKKEVVKAPASESKFNSYGINDGKNKNTVPAW